MKYTTPEMNIVKFEAMEVIVASGAVVEPTQEPTMEVEMF